LKNIFLIIAVLGCFAVLPFCRPGSSGRKSESERSSPIAAIEIPDRPVSGKIAGMEWDFITGRAVASLWDKSKISVELYNTPVDDVCKSWDESREMIFFSVPKKEGTYELNIDPAASQTVTLYDADAGKNYVVADGVLIVDRIYKERIYLTMKIRKDDNNYAEGRCLVFLCKESR